MSAYLQQVARLHALHYASAQHQQAIQWAEQARKRLDDARRKVAA